MTWASMWFPEPLFSYLWNGEKPSALIWGLRKVPP